MKDEKICWFVFYNDQLLMEKDNKGGGIIPCSTESPVSISQSQTIHEFTSPNGFPYKAVALTMPVEETDKYVMIDLRAAYDYLPHKEFVMAGKAREILYWDEHSRFCPVCGEPTQQMASIMKVCPACKNEMFPSISTAILALVRKEDSVLLVRALNFRGTHYGLVAGFLETGENLEECVQREVLEETGLKIKNIKYFGSQPWPFPSGLMVGFIADYESGEISLQKEELSAGAFYSRDNLPELPRKLSLARKMIDWWINEPVSGQQCPI